MDPFIENIVKLITRLLSNKELLIVVLFLVGPILSAIFKGIKESKRRQREVAERRAGRMPEVNETREVRNEAEESDTTEAEEVFVPPPPPPRAPVFAPRTFEASRPPVGERPVATISESDLVAPREEIVASSVGTGALTSSAQPIASLEAVRLKSTFEEHDTSMEVRGVYEVEAHEGERALVGERPDSLKHFDWRTAIIYREILQPPLALRKHQEYS